MAARFILPLAAPRVVRAFASGLLDLRCLVNEMNSKLTGYWVRCARTLSPLKSSRRRDAACARAHVSHVDVSETTVSVSVSNVELDGSRRRQTRHDQSSQQRFRYICFRRQHHPHIRASDDRSTG